MKELKIFGSLFFLTLLISVGICVMFYFFNDIFFPKKPTAGFELSFTSNVNSSIGEILFFSVLGGGIAGIVSGILTIILSSVFLIVVSRFVENSQLPLWSIFTFSVLTGGISFYFFYSDISSLKAINGEDIYQLVGSFVGGAIIGFLPLLIVKRLFNL